MPLVGIADGCDELPAPSQPEVLVYLDDIVIMSMNREEHMKLLEEVLDRLSKAHLVLNPAKCQWVQESVRYLAPGQLSESAAPARVCVPAA